MHTERIHSLILGAGPSGLAAGYTLAKAGVKPVVLEKDKVPGGLMRSIKYGDFIVDIGRKELYNRIAKVDALWNEIFGRDYRDYPHRGGILYKGRIIDMSPAFRGVRRGMPGSIFLACSLDFLLAQWRPRSAKPRTVEEYFYQTRGRHLTQTFSQGFQEKLTGKKWAYVSLPQNGGGSDNGAGFLSIMKEALMRAFSQKENNTYKGIWRHPAKGSGQISEILAEKIIRLGGRVHYQAKLLKIASSKGIINSVTAEIGSERTVFMPSYGVSSIPPEFLKRFLYPYILRPDQVRPESFTLTGSQTDRRACLPVSKRGAPVPPCLAECDLPKYKDRQNYELFGL